MGTAFLRNWFFTVLFFSDLVLGLSAHATVTVESVRGVSRWEKEEGNPIIYGGFAGSEESECTDNSDGTCNNCSVHLRACNERRAKLNSGVRITIKSDSIDGSGPIIITNSDGKLQIGDDGEVVGANRAGSVELTWSTICNGAFPENDRPASCVSQMDSSSVATLMIGVDEDRSGTLSSSEGSDLTLKVHKPIDADTMNLCDNSDSNDSGLCSFELTPGDEKLFVEELEHTLLFPSSHNIQFIRARFFLSTAGFTGGVDGANPGSQNGYTDIKIETEGDEFFLAEDNIDKLSNGSVYFARVAMVDQANNVAFITSNQAILSACGKPAHSLKANSTDDDHCQFMAKPGPVVGLLPKNINCLIATAAHNSGLNNHLKTFRSFRRQFLLNFEWGKVFVRSYYKYSPYAAHWIEKHSWFKPIVRALLWPLWAWAHLSLKWGWISATLIFFFSLSLMILLVRKLLLRRHQYEMAS